MPSRQWLDLAFSSRGLATPTVQIVANSIPLLPRVIAKTHLLSFLSRQTLALQGGQSLREVRLKATTLRRSLGITWRREGYLSPASLRVIELLRIHGNSMLASDSRQDSHAKQDPNCRVPA